MKKRTIYYLLVLIPILLLGAAAPLAAEPAQQTNLLSNPGFEDPYNSDGSAGSWVRWHRESSADQFGDCANGYRKKPGWNAERNLTQFIREGSVSQLVGNNWDTWSGGVWQTVSVTPGTTYRFTFYGIGRGSNSRDEASDTSLNMNMRAGIDPNGSGLWNDADVVWGGSGSPHEQWQSFSVEATATSDKMTVFTSADWAVQGVNQCRKLLETWYDSASLVEVGPPPTNTPPPPPPATATSAVPPTNTPAPEPTATNAPEATVEPTATVEPSPTPITGGTVCVNAFSDENGNGQHDSNEGYIGGVTFTVGNSSTLVGQAVSSGTDKPVCFAGVEPGTYQVSQILPNRLEMTTAGNATIAVEEGGTVGLEFGSRLRLDNGETAVSDTSTTTGGETGESSGGETAVSPGEATTTPETTPAESGSLLANSGLIIIGLGIVLLGGLLFWLLRRQTS
ncbi:MAG: hypothetical protein KDE56_17395 [Anaerolineales bacterium]|nr:hypothetical protein [Anaerolineales bacterium]